MDRPLQSTEKRKNRLRLWLPIGLVTLGLGLAFWGLRQALTTKIATKDFRFATVELGSMENSITATGLVVPTFEQQLNAPVTSEVKAVYLTSGAEVKTGTLMMELNEEFTRLAYESLDDELELKKNNITKLKLEYDKNLKELAYENEIKGLQLSSLEVELADKKRLKTIGGATQEEVDRAALNLKIAQLEKKKLENDLQFREAAIVSDQRNLELEVLIQDKKKRELEKKLTQTKVTAPQTGVITWIQEKIGQKVNEGEPLVRIANLEQFRVEASCSDRYANSVNIGALDPSAAGLGLPPSSLRLAIWAVSAAAAASLVACSYSLFSKAFRSSGAFSWVRISTYCFFAVSAASRSFLASESQPIARNSVWNIAAIVLRSVRLGSGVLRVRSGGGVSAGGLEVSLLNRAV